LGLARNINLHQNSPPETNSKAKRRRPKTPVRLLSGTQVTAVSREEGVREEKKRQGRFRSRENAVTLVPEGSLAQNFRAGSGRTTTPEHPRSLGLARNINLHQNSAPETTSKTRWRHPKTPPRLPSSTQVTSVSACGTDTPAGSACSACGCVCAGCHLEVVSLSRCWGAAGPCDGKPAGLQSVAPRGRVA